MYGMYVCVCVDLCLFTHLKLNWRQRAAARRHSSRLKFVCMCRHSNVQRYSLDNRIWNGKLIGLFRFDWKSTHPNEHRWHRVCSTRITKTQHHPDIWCCFELTNRPLLQWYLKRPIDQRPTAHFDGRSQSRLAFQWNPWHWIKAHRPFHDHRTVSQADSTLNELNDSLSCPRNWALFKEKIKCC